MRLSDSLHGAADGAPVDDVHVSAVEAARRVQRRRTMRTSGFTAAAVLGVGMLGLGAVQLAPHLGGMASSGAADTAASADADGWGDESLAEADDSMGTMLAAGSCGTTLDGLAYGTPTVSLSGELASEEVESGGTLDWEATTTALEDVALQTGRPLTYAYVLWDGIIVGTYPGPDDAFTDDLLPVKMPAGESSTEEGTMPLVNCWDGEPLPAGEYEVVLAHELWNADDVTDRGLDSTESPTPEADVTPESDTDTGETSGSEDVGSDEPAEPTVAPDDAVTSGSTGSGAASSGIASDQGFRVLSDALDFTIAGDAVDEPFADYLGGDDPIVEPSSDASAYDDLLTPDIARALYEEGLAGAWNMAPGTQRVVLTSDSEDDDGSLWEQSWYGCSYDDEESTFPAESAVIDLLDVDVATPSVLPVSYGWVVDGNPEMTSQVTNVSEWTVPYWSDAQPNLLLVQDGRVIAQAYPASTDRYGEVWMADDVALGAESGDAASIEIMPAYSDGYLEPGSTVGGTYLWRDVDTCDYTSDLPAGTYTVLDQRSIYLETAGVYSSEDYDLPAVDDAVEETWIEEGAAGGGTDTDADVSVETIAVEPEYDEGDYDYEWLELTVWTSLGDVRVTIR